MLTFRNDTLTPVGLWDVANVHHVVSPLGGTVTLDPSQSAQETIDILVAAGSGYVTPGEAPTVSAGVISGDPIIGQELGVAPTVSGEPSPSVEAQWLKDGEPIAGATNPVYTLIGDDEGAMISCRITATNPAGSATDTTAEVGPVEAPE